MRWGGMNGDTWLYMPDPGYFLGIFGGGQDTAMARFGPLGQFNLDHLHLWPQRIFTRSGIIKRPITISASKITGTDLPDKVAPMLQMIVADSTFPGIVRKISHFSSLVHGQYRILAEGSETHR